MFRRKPAPDDTNEGVGLTRSEFETMQCMHCGGAHLRACPRVKRLVFGPGSNIQEVEFWEDGSWDTTSIIWPEEIEEESDGD